MKKKSRDSRIEISNQLDSSKHARMVCIVKEHMYLWADLGMAVIFGSSSSINGSNETLGCESLPLSQVRSIEDGALRFFHVAREE